MNPVKPLLTSQMPEAEWYRRRLLVSVCIVLPVFAALFFRLFYLQIIEGENYRLLSENNCIRLQKIDSPRGLIYDRNGTLLVDNRPSYDVGLVLKDAKPLEPALQNLAYFLGIPEADIDAVIERKKQYAAFRPITVKENISRDVLAFIEANRYDIPGMVIDVRLKRYYVFPGIAAHVLGYLGEISSGEMAMERFMAYRRGDTIGKYGVERSYEDMLNGRRGGRQIIVDAKGRLSTVLDTIPSVPGANLFLTIDLDLQRKAESLLKGWAGAACVIETHTGKVLAMASSPGFNPNDFIDGMRRDQWEQLTKNTFRPLENKAIQAEYPPASTYKIITAIAGLEEGVIDERTVFQCPGYLKFGDREYRCWRKGGHGTVNVVRAIAESCDVFFYQTGLRLGVDRLASYAKAFGLGTPTGLRLDGEASGLIPTAAWKKRKTGTSWQQGETLSVAIGQGYNLVTPLQNAVMMAAIANGGYLMTPVLVERIENPDGDVIEEGKPHVRGRISLSAKTLSLVQKGLWEVVNGASGTARNARIADTVIAGKTGTAQVFSRKTSGPDEERRAMHLRSHAWFVAYAPFESPKIAVSVIVEHGEHGSSAAAPIASELIRAYFNRPEDRDGGMKE
ncbi:MAG: penicillin-binding protein 2 [Thermodesulfobacteriota bacterium]